MGYGFLRSSLFVEDIDRAIQWYEAVFGMTPDSDMTLKLPGPLIPSGKEGDDIRIVTLANKDSATSGLALLQTYGQGGVEPKAPTIETAIHVVHAENVREVLERAKKAGSRIHCGYLRWSANLPDETVVLLGGCSFWDLDGHFFEVLEPNRVAPSTKTSRESHIININKGRR